MWQSFLAFNQNAVSNFIYLMTSNVWFMLLLIGMAGTVFLQLKDEIDKSVNDTQRIL